MNRQYQYSNGNLKLFMQSTTQVSCKQKRASLVGMHQLLNGTNEECFFAIFISLIMYKSKKIMSGKVIIP